MSLNLNSDHGNELLYISFNQDNGCFACGTDSGFRIYNVDPFKETFRRAFSNGGIGIVEMLFRCNLLALVGGGRNPRYPTNKVMIWDDHQSRCIGELMFKSEVKAVKLRRDKVVVALATKIFVYRFSDLKLLDQITTLANPKGLIALCPDPTNCVLACPGLSKGSIRIELYDLSKATLIKAHDADLACISLNSDGSKIASASEKGTLIRLWDCHTGEPLRELRRGVDRAEIYCISFNVSSTYIACSSDKGTIHIFSIVDGGSGPQNSANNTNGSAGELSNHNSGLSFMRGLVPGLVPRYFGSEWSCAQVRGIDGKSICAFDKDLLHLNVLSSDGNFLVCSFDDGGECTRLNTARFVKLDDGQGDTADYTNSITSATGTVSTVSRQTNE